MMDLRINGSYQAYAYIILLQLSVLYLQRLDLSRRLRDAKSKSPDFFSIDTYLIATRFIAAAVNWSSWLLAFYVGQKFSVASGVLFLILALGSSIIATVVIPPLPRIDLVAHAISFPATIYLLRATLLALGVQTSY
jgi:hypothetical protein